MGTYFSVRRRLAEDPTGTAWRPAVDELLELADRRLARGRTASALRWFDKALRLSYHGSLHQEGTSPLVAAPQEFLRPLRSSAIGRIMLETPIGPQGAPLRPAARERTPGEPTRLLVIAQENWTFITPIIDALQEGGGFEVRRLDVDELSGPGLPDREQILRGRFDAVTTGRRMPTPPELEAAFAWADTVLVEWCHHVLTWVTLLDIAPRRLTTRLHRFEAFTPFTLMHDVRRIDRLLYVSPPVYGLVTTVAPALAGVPASKVGNLLARGIGPAPAQTHDRLLLTQVGWIREVKDVLFSLDVLEILRRHDQRFRLRLIGPGLGREEAEDTAYQRTVRRRLSALEPGAVEMLGVRDDVPALLSESGFILSSSRHEGTHESVMEGLAAGCVAVIRNWPDAAPHGGASTVYEAAWVVPDAESAARRILELQDPALWTAEAREGRDFVVQQRDPARVIAVYAAVLRPAAGAA